MDYLCLKGALVTRIILFKMAEDQNQKMHSIVFFLHGIVMPAITTSYSIITLVCVNEALQLHESVYICDPLYENLTYDAKLNFSYEQK